MASICPIVHQDDATDEERPSVEVQLERDAEEAALLSAEDEQCHNL
jgi:hypothetical protein